MMLHLCKSSLLHQWKESLVPFEELLMRSLHPFFGGLSLTSSLLVIDLFRFRLVFQCFCDDISLDLFSSLGCIFFSFHVWQLFSWCFPPLSNQKLLGEQYSWPQQTSSSQTVSSFPGVGPAKVDIFWRVLPFVLLATRAIFQ